MGPRICTSSRDRRPVCGSTGNFARSTPWRRPSDEFEAGILAFLSEEERQRLLAEGSVDLAYELDGEARFRINVYRQESGISLAARIVPRRIPSFDELHLPPVIATIADNRQGLVLVSGATGSGKSTTIAAVLEHINCTRYEHIVTIEDPIEFLYVEKKCLINQREMGINVSDFSLALRALWREDPDVVLIGEMAMRRRFGPRCKRPTPDTWCSARFTPPARPRRLNGC